MRRRILKRLDTPELLDEHDAPRDEVDRSLRDLRRINSLFGGHRIFRKLLRQFGSGRLRIVDLGTGSSDLLEGFRGDHFRVGVDFKIDHLLYPRANGARTRIHRVVGDAHHLPFRSGAVDVVTSSHFFHHFTPEENARILDDSLRVARRGVAVTDTRRHWIPLLVVVLLGALRLVGEITRFDAPASVRRGYTLPEVRGIVDHVSATRKRVVRMWPFRYGILLWK